MSKRHTRRHRPRPTLATASGPGGTRLVMAAADPLVDVEARTIQGLVVPFGRPGQTSAGSLTFAEGRLTIAGARRVKLLREHDQHDSVGFGASFEEIDAGEVDRRMAAAGLDPLGVPGVWGRFNVPEGDNGDRALAEAANGLRDGFSVGVQLDEATTRRLHRAQGSAVDAAGTLREVSLVSVPAFDDARVAAAAGAELVVSGWTDTPTIPRTTHTTAAAGGTTPKGHSMTPEQIARLAELANQTQLSDEERAELAELTAAAGGTTPPADQTPPAPAQAGAALTTAAAGPSTVPAYAGAAVVTSEPSTYNFSSGHSIVSDLYRGAMHRDVEAQQRVDRFNAELASENPASVSAFMTAAATRENVDGAGTDLPSFFSPNPNRPDLMRAAVDVKRPFISRLDRVPINNAQPFAIPKVGKFEGVGPHTEGTPHRPAGTLTLGGGTVQPTATSGAWEVSRELLDAATPALDRIAAREMLRDYTRQTEGKVIDLVAAYAALAEAQVYNNVNTVMALRSAMLDFVNDDDEPGNLAIVSKIMLREFGEDVDGMDRPQLPYVTPVNSAGSMRAGYTGFAVDGVEVTRSARLDSGVGAGSGVLARTEGILWAESNVLQFRFDEVLGPGVIKLALWAYNAAAILDTADVALLSTGAAVETDADPAT